MKTKPFFVWCALLFVAVPALGRESSSVPDNSQSFLESSKDQVVNVDDSVTIRLGPSSLQTFYPLDLDNLSKAYVKLTGASMADDKVIDDFAIINYCTLYKAQYRNEFVWRRAREAIRAVIERDLESYPEYFHVSGTIKLGRYDFITKAFVLDESKFDKTGLFALSVNATSKCDRTKFFDFPTDIEVRLTNPVTLAAIPVSEEFAANVAKEMDRTENYDRLAYVAFYFRVNDFNRRVVQGRVSRSATVRATLMSMRIYADEKKTFMIYDYRPR